MRKQDCAEPVIETPGSPRSIVAGDKFFSIISQVMTRFSGGGSFASVVSILCVLVALASCEERETSTYQSRPEYVPEFYASERIEAVVVDADTQRPVPGAVVVAVWRQVDVRIECWADRLFGTSEVRTDASGRFTILRWGPRLSSPQAFIDSRSPELWVLKRGYLVGFFDNTGAQQPMISLMEQAHSLASVAYVTLPPNKTPGSTRGARARAAGGSSLWNGKTLHLRRPGSELNLAESLAAANPFERDLSRKLTPLPMYWDEWHRSRELLSADLQPRVPFPPYTLTDYIVVAERRTAAN